MDKEAKKIEVQDSKETALHYMKTLVDVARESFLILDADIRVVAANPIFYETFKVSPSETENIFIYELGNGQWDIPELRNLLEKILPEKKIVTGYEVSHVFETIGGKTMLLNAGQIDSVKLIILAIEDVTSRKNMELKLAAYTKGLEATVVLRTAELVNRVRELETMNKTMVGRELKMVELKKEIESLKEQIKVCNETHKKGSGNES